MSNSIHLCSELPVLGNRRGEIVKDVTHPVFPQEFQFGQTRGKLRQVVKDMVAGGSRVPVFCLPESEAELPLVEESFRSLMSFLQHVNVRSNGFFLPSQVVVEDI